MQDIPSLQWILSLTGQQLVTQIQHYPFLLMIRPKKDLTSFFMRGRGCEQRFYPPVVKPHHVLTITPGTLPALWPTDTGQDSVSGQPAGPWQGFVLDWKVLLPGVTEDEHIIQIGRTVVLALRGIVHQLLERGRCTIEAKGHHWELEEAGSCLENKLLRVSASSPCREPSSVVDRWSGHHVSIEFQYCIEFPEVKQMQRELSFFNIMTTELHHSDCDGSIRCCISYCISSLPTRCGGTN